MKRLPSDSGSRSPLHSLTWLVWALASAASIQLAPSPVYVAVVIAAAAVVVRAHALDTPLARAFPVLLGLGIAFALLRVVLTALTTHGAGNTIWIAPKATLPRLFGGFTVGGSIELPVVLQSAAEGLVVVGVMAAFGAFNSVISHHELIGMLPRAFYEPGLVVTIALAFVPSTIEAVGAVREADRARTGGRVVRRGRLLRMAVPVLESGMERAMALAESMDSRGFGRLRVSARDRAAGWCGLAALIGLGCAFVALVGRASRAALVLFLGGLFSLVSAVVLASGGARPALRRRITRRDRLVAGLVAAAPATVAVLSLAGDESLVWNVSPVAFPVFHLPVALALCALLIPVLVRR